MSSIRAVPYFAVQRARSGLRPDQIRAASALLERSADGIAGHVRSRLVALHGEPALEPTWLLSRPLVERSSLVPVHAAALERGVRGIEARRTSGSTGVPFRFVRSKEMLAWMDAAMWAAYAWHGIAPGDRRLRFWGVPPSAGARLKRRLADLVTGQLRLNAFELHPEAATGHFLRARRYGARYAYGYPTMVGRWAELCKAGGLDGRELGLRCVITTGELLSPATRGQLSTFFGCPVVNEYGCTESGIIAFECEAGTAHLLPIAAFAEIVSDDGIPVRPGSSGEVVVSDLYGTVLPLLRYRLHDIAVPLRGAACSCGRELPSIEVAIGRQGGFIQLLSGRQVFATLLAYTVLPEVAAFRARQRTPRLLEADITVRPGADPQLVAARLRTAWRAALGEEIDVTITVVPTLHFEPSGKLRYFIPLGS